MLAHRIWLGGDMPTKYREYGQEWERLNSELTLRDWTEEEIMDGHWYNKDVLSDMWKKSRQPGADMIAYYTHVADVVDYELCYEYGGWYFNTDLKPLQPLSRLDFDPNYPAFAMEDDIHPVNMAMYSPQYSWMFEKIIRMLAKRYFSMPGAFMNASTGVQLIQDALRSYPEHVQFYPRHVFNPIHWSEFDYGADAPVDQEFGPETVAVHEWLHRTNQRGQRILEDG